MIRTYTVIDVDSEVVEYFRNLSEAKRFVVKYFDKGFKIRALRGPSYGEGYHFYILTLNTNKLTFKREYIRFSNLLNAKY